MKLLRRIGEALSYLLSDSQHPAALDGEAFCRLYDASGTVPKDIVIRLRKTCRRQLRSPSWAKPEEITLGDEIDLVDFMYEVGDEFGIQISEKVLEQMDGSFDSTVRFLVARLK
jgi:hypothetical protein